MKIITPQEFDQLGQKDNLLYVGRIRAADYIWVHRSETDNSLVNLGCIARELQGDFLVTQTINNDDWSWASRYLNGKVCMDDTTFVAAGNLYRDPAIQKNATYINNELLTQIKPQLGDLGSLSVDKYVDSGSDPFGAELKLLEKATEEGADYVVLESSYDLEPSISEFPARVTISKGRIYKLKGLNIKNEIEITPSVQHPTFVAEPPAHDSIALDYAKRLLAGNAGGTILDWKKQ